MSEMHGHRAEPTGSRGRGVVLGLVGLLVLAAVGYFGLKATGLFGSSSADYSGAGHSPTFTIQVVNGDAQQISKELKDAGVVASQTAFINAANANPGWVNLQRCSYSLNTGMKASLAVAWLVDKSHCTSANVVTVQEGWRVTQVISAIAAKSSIEPSALRAAIAKPASIGLPSVADGDVEGYLFPSTYQLTKGLTATQLLSQMVTQAKTQFLQVGIEAGSPTGGLSPRQVLVLASIIQAESGGSDMAKVARVFYNRLAQGMMLQSDATVAYANNLSGTVWTTDAQRNNPSPYNTYVHQGLPPGPIDNPGLAAIKAALHPASGPWLYFVPINLKTGETAYSTTYAQHQAAVAQLQAWCAQTHYTGCK